MNWKNSSFAMEHNATKIIGVRISTGTAAAVRRHRWRRRRRRWRWRKINFFFFAATFAAFACVVRASFHSSTMYIVALVFRFNRFRPEWVFSFRSFLFPLAKRNERWKKIIATRFLYFFSLFFSISWKMCSCPFFPSRSLFYVFLRECTGIWAFGCRTGRLSVAGNRNNRFIRCSGWHPNRTMLEIAGIAEFE